MFMSRERDVGIIVIDLVLPCDMGSAAPPPSLSFNLKRLVHRL